MSRQRYRVASCLLLASVIACAAPEKASEPFVQGPADDGQAASAREDSPRKQTLVSESAATAAVDYDTASLQEERSRDRRKGESSAPAAAEGPPPSLDAIAGGAVATKADVAKPKAVERKVRAPLARPAREPAPPSAPPLVATGYAPEQEPARPDPGGTFVHAGVNPLTDTREDNLSTFAIDVDTASYTYARRFMQSGQRPSAGSVRVEEWVNAFHYEYEGPKDKLPFAVHLAAAPSPFVNGRHLVRVGIQGKRVAKSERKPVHLTFLVDVSGSMYTPDKLPLAQKALHMLTDELRADDSVAIVTYAGRTGEVLSATKATKDGKRRIHDAIERLRAGGGTNMSSGMELAYKNAHRFLSSESNSRVIVLSDGDANIGYTSHQEILKRIAGYVSEGVTMSTVGFGTGNYRDHLMEQLANAGNGNYSYIDSEKAARRVFVEDLTGTLEVIAQDVKIQVDFDPSRVAAYRLIGYENRDIADKDFRNDRVDAGEIGAGHTVTALYEVVLRDGDHASELGDIATVRIRHKKPRGVKATEIARTLTGADVKASFEGLDTDTRFAAAAALSAEILRGSEHVAHLTLEDARAIAANAAVGRYAEERRELVDLLSKVIEHRPAYSRR